MLTSVDIVSEASDRFRTIVPPALKHTDYCIINEYEAGKTADIPLRDEAGALMADKIPLVLKALKDMGVARWAVIHAPEGAYGLDEENHYHEIPSLKLPRTSSRAPPAPGTPSAPACSMAPMRGCPLRTPCAWAPPPQRCP